MDNGQWTMGPEDTERGGGDDRTPSRMLDDRTRILQMNLGVIVDLVHAADQLEETNHPLEVAPAELVVGLEFLEAVVVLRMRPLRSQKKQIGDIVDALQNATFADAERVCLDVRKRCALDGCSSLRQSDIDAAIERFRYRRSVQKKAVPEGDSPAVDRE